VFFIGFSVVAILLGTIQGVIQILQPVEEWLDDALPSSYYVTPLAHAQLNMVGFAIVALMTMSIFVLPRILGKEPVDPVSGRRALSVLAVGISASYVVFAGVGIIESIAIHNGATPNEALDVVGGFVGRYLLFILAQGIVGAGYFLLFRHISATIGREAIRGYYATFYGRMRSAGRLAVRVHPSAMPADLASAQRKAIAAGLLEVVVGLGWLYSGRPFVGAMLLGSCGGGFWTIAYVVLASAGGEGPLPLLFGIYAVLAVMSGLGSYRSFMSDAMLRFSAAE
jgi:hypothetical protein